MLTSEELLTLWLLSLFYSVILQLPS